MFYKEKIHYEFYHFDLEKHGLKFRNNDHQSMLSTLMVGSHDTMNIKAPERIIECENNKVCEQAVEYIFYGSEDIQFVNPTVESPVRTQEVIKGLNLDFLKPVLNEILQSKISKLTVIMVILTIIIAVLTIVLFFK